MRHPKDIKRVVHGSEDEALRLEEELKTNGHNVQTSITMQEACDLTDRIFWSSQRDGLKSFRMGQEVVDFFGRDTPLSAMKPTDVAAFKAHLRSKGNSNSTINKKTSAINRMWTAAGSEGRVTRLSQPIILREKEPKGRLRWLLPQDESELLSFFHQRTKYGVMDWTVFSNDTGVRPAESFNINPSRDIQGNELTVECRFGIGDDGEDEDNFFTKNMETRTVPLTDRCMEIVKRRSNRELLFEDVPYTKVYYWFKRARKLLFKGDKGILPYVCRHTCASRLVQKGMDIYKVKKWMGHSSITVTERYAKMSSKDIQFGAGLLDEFTEDVQSLVVPRSA